MIRKLYLLNETGTPYFFDKLHNTLIEKIDGLGFDYDITYQEFDTDYVEVTRKLSRRTISLELVFLKGYKGFTEWREYVTKSKSLRLVYKADGEKYCFVNVKSSTKGQLTSQTIKSKVTLDCLSSWFVDKTVRIDVVDEGGGKVYSYSYPYVYSLSFNGKVKVFNNSNKSVPLHIKISGNCLNPRVIIRQNGVDIQGLRILTDERNSPVIEISSRATEQYIIKRENGEVLDYYSFQDFTYDNFLFLPPGESEIFFDPGVRERCSCQISYKEEFIAH